MAANIKERRFTLEITRPANGITYAAQDAVYTGTSGTIVSPLIPVLSNDIKGNWLVPGGSYQIKQSKLTKSTATTTNASFDVYFYTSGITATQDNQPMNLAYANKHVRIGKTAHTMLTGDSSTSTSSESVNTDVNLNFIALPPNSSNLSTAPGFIQGADNASIYAQIVATAAYAPGSSEKFFLEVLIIGLDE